MPTTTTNPDNKITYGVSKMYYSVLTETSSGVEFGTPVEIPGAVNISLSPEGELYKFYADNVVYYARNGNNGYTGSIEIANIPDSMYEDVFDMEADAKGVYVEKIDSIPKYVAIGFQFEGDLHARRFWLYKCLIARPNVESATKEESIEPQTKTLELTVLPLDDGRVKAESGKDVDSTTYAGWFTEVYETAAVSS